MRTLTMAAALMTIIASPAFAQYATSPAPAPASTCPPGQTLVGGVCSIVGGAVGAAGAVAGGALGAAGAITGGAVNAAGQVVGGTVGAVTGAPPAPAVPQAAAPKTVPGNCGPGYVLYQGGCFPGGPR